jgi:triacylglycerol esterase/lipase EstA (alpha/beta hydrolase family)
MTSFSRAFCAFALVAALVVGVVAPTGAAAQYPVPYLFSANIIAGATQQGSPPPGANDWSCKPTKAHPRPVVLVHGLLANMTTNWQTMSPLLANNGYCVFALSYGVPPDAAPPTDQFGGLNAMEESAAELKAFVDEVLAVTGARKVDLVGHSEGATMPDYYIGYLGGAAKVNHYVGVAGVKHGTTLHGIGTFAAEYGSLFTGASSAIASCVSCTQFLVGSNYIKKVEARAPARGVTYTNLATRYDELVTPHTTSFLTGPKVTNILLQDHCALDASDHLSIISSPITGQYILNALDPAHKRPVPCVPVLPAA